LTALIDMPWTPVFLAAIFVFHPSLGWLSIGGGAVLVLVTLANQRIGKTPTLRANATAIEAERMSDRLKSEAELLRALGMSDAAFRRWQSARTTALGAAMQSADLGGGFSTATRTLRQFLQSAMLGLGAFLVLQGEMTAGAMIAGSILMGRALAPIEQAVGQWAVLTRAREAQERLSLLLTQHQPQPRRTALPRPRAVLEVEGLTIVPAGASVPVLRNVSFTLRPGQALGIIGPSGAGKSTLGRALIGALRPAGGKVRLDGALLDQYDPDTLGSYFGYLPQSVALFDASVSDNIARLSTTPDDAKVVAAARAAAAHDMILRLPDGYDTRVSSSGGRLSGGQIQRVGLARALYGEPVLLVLDEPNSNLDNEGSMALNLAIRQIKETGGSVIVIAHRPAAIQECDLLLVLEEGTRRAFGPRDEVLREMVKNHTEIVRSKGPGGVS
jgi:ATP-binding cassette subfamily C protein